MRIVDGEAFLFILASFDIKLKENHLLVHLIELLVSCLDLALQLPLVIRCLLKLLLQLHDLHVLLVNLGSPVLLFKATLLRGLL